MPLIIKGVIESSQANNITIEAKLNNSSTVSAQDDFTVAIITLLVFEKFEPDYTELDNNPGNGQPGSGIGQRIFPDKLTLMPADIKDRSLVKVKATVSPAVPNVTVYFGSYDLDDPSTDATPIDTTGANGNDNNGAVNGSKSGDFTVPTGINCTNPPTGPVPGKIGCVIASDGTATAVFKTTMQPGDNFAIAVSLSDTYRDEIRVAQASGTQLLNMGGGVIHLSGEVNEDQNAGIRTKMLTVWRRLHIEVDSMGNVDSGNRVTGTVVADGRKIPPSTVNIQVTPTNPSTPLELNRFENGRIVIGSRSYGVIVNGKDQNGNDVVQFRVLTTVNIANGEAFKLYDDDDYNTDDGTNLDGDSIEPIVRLPDSFRYLSAEDGNYPDGKPRNLYASAYIMPEYNWAENVARYNQTNLGFNLNVPVANVSTLINANRNSNNDEKVDFWIAYFLIAYQGDEIEDADGYRIDPDDNMLKLESANSGITIGFGYVACDCYQIGTCIGTSCATIIPKGGFGSLIYQEVMQDATRTWLRDGNLVIQNQGTTAPHELGHQFGLKGDNFDPVTGRQTRPVATYRIMDYPHRPSETDDYGFHPEHINIMRRRVNSPGQ